jgi:uncharacterized protein (TIGR03435 family)
MMETAFRRIGCNALCTLALASFALAQPPVVKVFHPNGPLPSYDVAIIKPADPNNQFSGRTLRKFIASAYGVPIPWGVPGGAFEGSQVVGGPAWIDKDRYDIHGKASDEQREAMQKMSRDDRRAQTEMMDQSLLADRFHLKVHFETREMSVFELVPAKGGLKITSVDPPPTGAESKPYKWGDPLPPGMNTLQVMGNGVSILNARAITMEQLTNALRGQSPDVAGRPIIDMTGFKGNFDVKDLRFIGIAPPEIAHSPGNATEPDAPSLQQALQDQLGMKLVPAKGQVEVVVIDSIDRPTEN